MTEDANKTNEKTLEEKSFSFQPADIEKLIADNIRMHDLIETFKLDAPRLDQANALFDRYRGQDIAQAIGMETNKNLRKLTLTMIKISGFLETLTAQTGKPIPSTGTPGTLVGKTAKP
jgi:hypothetical protein